VGGTAFLSPAQEMALKAFVTASLPRNTRQIGAFIEKEFGIVYESRSGVIALLHRLRLVYHKPEVIPRRGPSSKAMRSISIRWARRRCCLRTRCIRPRGALGGVLGAQGRDAGD